MNTYNNTDIFTQLKNKNIQEDKILSLLEEIIKVEPINKIQKYGCNLLIFCCLYDNDNAFKILADNFSTQFKDDFKKCVFLTYTNKNPNILKLSLHNMNLQNEFEKEELLKKFANNCFRSENIEITQNWLQNNLNDTQLELFISELFRNNNKPYLFQISKLIFWKEQIKKYDFSETKNNVNFYKMLIDEPIFNNSSISNVETEIIEENIRDTGKKSKDLIVLKKRKKTFSLLTA